MKLKQWGWRGGWRALAGLGLLVVLGGAVGGCGGQDKSIDPSANLVDPDKLVPAQGHLAPGVVIYDDGGEKVGRVVKVDPDYVFANGRRGGVLMDWDKPGEEDSYMAMFWFDTALVRPS